MDISGLSISGSRSRPAQAAPAPRRGGGRREGKAEASSSSSSSRGRSSFSAAAERQRKQHAGHATDKYVLASDGSEGHDVTKFTFREDPDFENVDPEAFGISRAKQWTPEVENGYRLQQCGWRDVYEYRKTHGEPEIWRASGLISKVYDKKTGWITYWKQERECPRSKLHLVKIFKYRAPSTEGKSSRK